MRPCCAFDRHGRGACESAQPVWRTGAASTSVIQWLSIQRVQGHETKGETESVDSELCCVLCGCRCVRVRAAMHGARAIGVISARVCTCTCGSVSTFEPVTRPGQRRVSQCPVTTVLYSTVLYRRDTRQAFFVSCTVSKCVTYTLKSHTAVPCVLYP